MSRFAVLAEIAGCVMDAAADERALVSRLQRAAKTELRARSSVWLARPQDERLVCVAASGAPPDRAALAPDRAAPDPDRAALNADGTPPDRPAPGRDGELSRRSPRTINLDDPARVMVAASEGTKISRERLDRAIHRPVAGAIVLPLCHGDRLLGAWALSGATDPSIAQPPQTHNGAAELDRSADRDFATAVAAVAASTLYHARILADSIHLVDDLRRQSETMNDISDAFVACDSEWRVVSWNAGAERVYGYSATEVLGCELFALLDTRFHDSEVQPVSVEDVLLELSSSGHWRGELHERRADGTQLIMLSSLSVRGQPEHGLVVVNRDITDQRRQELAALHDPVTALPNRRMLTNRLHEAYARACRNDDTLAVMFVSLDGFEDVNQRHGAAAGEILLRTTASRLSRAVRVTDTVGRLGADQFVVVLERAGGVEDVQRVAGRLAVSLRAPVALDGQDLSGRASMGIAYVGDPATSGLTPDALLDAACQAMVDAKQAGAGTALVVLPEPANGPTGAGWPDPGSGMGAGTGSVRR